MTYVWDLDCPDGTKLSTNGPVLKYNFKTTRCGIKVAINPAKGEALHVDEQIEMFPDFTILRFGDFEFQKDTTAMIQIHGNFPSRDITFVWNFENGYMPDQITDTPHLTHVFKQVGFGKLHAKISNAAKTESVTSSVTIYGMVRGTLLEIFDQ